MCRPKKKGDSKSAPITFADVAGVDTAREELLEVVACLRDARRYSRLNAKTPSGVLLCGPPGTGKTLLGEHTPSCCPALHVGRRRAENRNNCTETKKQGKKNPQFDRKREII